MTPPDNGDDWNKWGTHVLAELARFNGWLQSIERRLTENHKISERRLWGVVLALIILLIGSLLKG